MFNFSIFGRQVDCDSVRRPRLRRRPVVEGLEGRQLLSGIQGNHIGVTADIVGNHIGTSVTPEIVGNHIGMAPAVRGGHVGS
jgi:hypothetical protein